MSSSSETHETPCPACGGKTNESQERQTFKFSEDGSVTLTAIVPVISCSACGFEYTDHRAEEIRHDTVCQHLNILFPSEIRSIRKSYGLSRKNFSDAFGFGEASIGRWENRKTFQNKALDNLLRLLRDRNNGARLLNTNRSESFDPSANELQDGSNVVPFTPRFHSLTKSEEKRERKYGQDFSLDSPRRRAL